MKLEQTKDGSYTLYNAEMDEHYHSIHGALQESLHVFIEHGLKLLSNRKEISVFEMGFGTGLNALLAYNFVQQNKITINYTTIEAFPIDDELVKQLPYAAFVEDKNLFAQLHQIAWNEKHLISPLFSFQKIKGKIEEVDMLRIPKADCIFYDAFAPSAQAHLWETPILQKMYDLLNPKGILSTYCAQGQFKRNLKAVGFTVEAFPGPPGKREMTMGKK